MLDLILALGKKLLSTLSVFKSVITLLLLLLYVAYKRVLIDLYELTVQVI